MLRIFCETWFLLRLLCWRALGKRRSYAIRELERILPKLEYPGLSVRIATDLYRQNGDFNKACFVYESYVELVKKGRKEGALYTSYILMDYATLLVDQGNFCKALEVSEELLRLSPELMNEQWREWLAWLSAAAGNHSKAAAYRAGESPNPNLN